MYTQKSKSDSVKSKRITYWIKRKILFIITSFMLGMSNAIYNEDKMVHGEDYIKQEQKKD
ncbi:hypothetical protein [Tenacibaculum jejuense]|uniref:hypothetical protein n=1 Tax=Tenacibaculum jejuense TaxID=584609 RepID=UPI000BA3CAE9|nr:hypothetical protein [Tenacibaculum jejuense]